MGGGGGTLPQNRNKGVPNRLCTNRQTGTQTDTHPVTFISEYFFKFRDFLLIRKYFPVWLRNRFISAVSELVVSHTEIICIADNFPPKLN